MVSQAKKLLYSLWGRIPQGRLRSSLRGAIHGGLTWRFQPSGRTALARELEQLDIERVGQNEDDTRFIRLGGGQIFFKRARIATERYSDRYSCLHRYLPDETQSRIPLSHMDMAIDIVFRYVYPHADPTLTPPYSYADRAFFHPQHRDTIDDIPGYNAEEKASLKRRFAIGSGDVVMDVGAYIGYGAMKLSRMVGSGGRIVALEANPDNQQMLLGNMEANSIENVQLVRKAIWSEAGELEMFCGSAQRNSLIDGIVGAKEAISVPTDSIDNVVCEQQLQKLTLVSLTINGAEIEAVRGMQRTLDQFAPKLLIAGWYHRGGNPVHKQVIKILQDHNYSAVAGRFGRVYAWNPKR